MQARTAPAMPASPLLVPLQPTSHSPASNLQGARPNTVPFGIPPSLTDSGAAPSGSCAATDAVITQFILPFNFPFGRGAFASGGLASQLFASGTAAAPSPGIETRPALDTSSPNKTSSSAPGKASHGAVLPADAPAVASASSADNPGERGGEATSHGRKRASKRVPKRRKLLLTEELEELSSMAADNTNSISKHRFPPTPKAVRAERAAATAAATTAAIPVHKSGVSTGTFNASAVSRFVLPPSLPAQASHGVLASQPQPYCFFSPFSPSGQHESVTAGSSTSSRGSMPNGMPGLSNGPSTRYPYPVSPMLMMTAALAPPSHALPGPQLAPQAHTASTIMSISISNAASGALAGGVTGIGADASLKRKRAQLPPDSRGTAASFTPTDTSSSREAGGSPDRADTSALLSGFPSPSPSPSRFYDGPRYPRRQLHSPQQGMSRHGGRRASSEGERGGRDRMSMSKSSYLPSLSPSPSPLPYDSPPNIRGGGPWGGNSSASRRMSAQHGGTSGGRQSAVWFDDSAALGGSGGAASDHLLLSPTHVSSTDGNPAGLPGRRPLAVVTAYSPNALARGRALATPGHEEADNGGQTRTAGSATASGGQTSSSMSSLAGGNLKKLADAALGFVSSAGSPANVLSSSSSSSTSSMQPMSTQLGNASPSMLSLVSDMRALRCSSLEVAKEGVMAMAVAAAVSAPMISPPGRVELTREPPHRWSSSLVSQMLTDEPTAPPSPPALARVGIRPQQLAASGNHRPPKHPDPHVPTADSGKDSRSSSSTAMPGLPVPTTKRRGRENRSSSISSASAASEVSVYSQDSHNDEDCHEGGASSRLADADIGLAAAAPTPLHPGQPLQPSQLKKGAAVPVQPPSAPAGATASRSHHRHAPTGGTDRPYVCQYPGCGMAFRQSTHLRGHNASVHLGLKPFPCAKCGKLWSRKENCRRHEKTCAGGRGAVDASTSRSDDASAPS